MELGIEGRVAMIAAASKGIGKAIAVGLAEEGCRVSICGRSQENLDAARHDLQAYVGPQEILTVVADVSKARDLEDWYKHTVDKYGTVDILVTNTGGPPAAKFMDLTDDQWEGGVQSTLMNIVRLCKLVIPPMQEKGWGRIIHVTSLVAKQPADDLTISSTLRTGISALTRTLSNQVAGDGILVNAVLPGNTLTDRQGPLANLASKTLWITPEEALAKTESTIPMKRMAEARESEDAVGF